MRQGPEHRERIVRCIGEFRAEHGYSPSAREIAATIGTTVSNTHWHLRVLREKGQVKWEPSKPRTLQVVP